MLQSAAVASQTTCSSHQETLATSCSSIPLNTDCKRTLDVVARAGLSTILPPDANSRQRTPICVYHRRMPTQPVTATYLSLPLATKQADPGPAGFQLCSWLFWKVCCYHPNWPWHLCVL